MFILSQSKATHTHTLVAQSNHPQMMYTINMIRCLHRSGPAVFHVLLLCLSSGLVLGDYLTTTLASLGLQPLYNNNLGTGQSQASPSQVISYSTQGTQANALDYFSGAMKSYDEQGHAPVSAAVGTKRTYEVRPVMIQGEPPVPSVVHVLPSEQPVQVVFRTHSSPVLVQQVHTPAQPPEVEKTSSEDEPHRVIHNVYR